MTDFTIIHKGKLRNHAVNLSNQCMIETDAPKDNHGKGECYSPSDLVAAALGSCLMTIMNIAAHKLSIHLDGLTAHVKKEMATEPRRISKIKVVIRAKKIPVEMQKKIEEAATKCPVHHSLHPSIVQDISFIWE